MSSMLGLKITDGNRSSLLAMLAIGLFMVFDLVGVSLNYLLSWRIEQQAIGINLAGRQRMLSQRMIKVLLQIDAARRSGEPTTLYFDELKLTFDLFDNTLRGFDVGNETKGGAGETLFLPAVTAPKARQAVDDAVVLWRDYRSQMAGLLISRESANAAMVQSVLAEATARNLKLLGLMNALTTELELLTQQEARRIRLYQAIALALALACFVWAFLLFRRRDAEMLAAKQSATAAAHAEADYVTQLVTRASDGLQTAEDLPNLAHQLFATLAAPCGIGCAAFYRYEAEHGTLNACGHYALADALAGLPTLTLDDGLVGECARAQQPRLIANPPASYLQARTGLVHAAPCAVALFPVVSNGTLLGMIEMALMQALDARHEEVIEALLPLLALRMEIIARNERAQGQRRSGADPEPTHLTSTGEIS